jgi:hypothetical protein
MRFLIFLLFPMTAAALTSTTSGSLRLNGGQLISPLDKDDVSYQSFSLEPEWKTQSQLSPPWSFQFEAWAKYDPADRSKTDVFQLELDEFSMAYVNGGRRLKFGSSFRNWEGTDLINPMDLLFSKNWKDPLNSRTRSALGIFYDDSFGDFSFDVTYLARQQAPLLPGEKSPWWPRGLYLPTESDDLVLRMNGKLDYEIEKTEILDHALDNNFALRLQYHGASWDLSVAGVEGLATPPLLVPIIDVAPIEVSPREIYELQSPVKIQPVLYRQRAVAGALVVTAGDWIFRLSANHVQPLGKDPRIPDWSELGVLGVERTFYFGNQMLTLMSQFIDSRRPDSAGVSLLTSLYQKSVMAGLRWAPSEKWTLLLAHFQETHFWSSFSRIDVTWNFRDNWSLDAEGNLFEGPEDSAIGTYDRNDSAYLHLKRSF